MTILVTGGTGLIGTRLLRRFADKETACRALVRAGKMLPLGIAPIEADILEPTTLADAVSGVSAIIHLAALLRTPDDKQIWTVNLDGTRNLIEAAKQYAPEARFIMASTSLVYDATSPRPAREDDPINPTAPYPASKAAAEAELRKSGLTWSILRFGFVYGERDGHLDALPSLADRFKWHPASKLSTIHHQDIANLTKLALSGALDGQIVNATDEAPLTIFELCELVGAPIAPSSEPLANPWSGQIDGTRARDLGFRPSVATVYQAVREGIL